MHITAIQQQSRYDCIAVRREPCLNPELVDSRIPLLDHRTIARFHYIISKVGEHAVGFDCEMTPNFSESSTINEGGSKPSMATFFTLKHLFTCVRAAFHEQQVYLHPMPMLLTHSFTIPWPACQLHISDDMTGEFMGRILTLMAADLEPPLPSLIMMVH